MTQLSSAIHPPIHPHTHLLPGTAQHVAVTQPSSPSDASDIVDATDPLRFTKGFALTSCSRNIQIYQAFNNQIQSKTMKLEASWPVVLVERL